MKLWMAAVFFIVCAVGAAFIIMLYRKSKKKGFIVPSIILIILSLALLIYSGLTLILAEGNKDPVPDIETEAQDIIDPVPDIKTEAYDIIDPVINEAIAIIEADRRDDLSTVTFGYEQTLVYDSLSGKDKAMYDEMLQKARELIPFSYTAEEHGYDEMDRAMRVYGAIQIDHPEIENYFIMNEVISDTMTVAVEARYFMPWNTEQNAADAEVLRKELELFDAVCERIVQSMPEGLSAYDQYRYLATVISLISSYDYDGDYGWQVATAYGSLVGGHSICQGYSRGFLVLCREADLWCRTAEGVAGENTSHMWNLVKLDSGTYHLDITWSDELGLPGSPEWYWYFMLTQDEISLDHIPTDDIVATGEYIAAP